MRGKSSSTVFTVEYTSARVRSFFRQSNTSLACFSVCSNCRAICLDFLLLFRRQLGRGLRQDVKDRQFFFRQLFRNATPIFLIEILGKSNQLLKEAIHVESLIVFLDQLLELLQQVGAGLVQLHHLLKFPTDRRFQLFRLGMLAALRKVGLQGVKINLTEVDERRFFRGMDDIALGCNRFVQQFPDLFHQVFDVGFFRK